MKTTLDLLAAAKTTLGVSERALSERLGHSPTTLTTGKRTGSLSPIVAGQLAELVGQPVAHWMAIAALESAPKSRITDHLRRAVSTVRNL